jgi:hypothetical protein
MTRIPEVWILFAFSSGALRVLTHPWTAAIPVAFSTLFGGGITLYQLGAFDCNQHLG